MVVRTDLNVHGRRGSYVVESGPKLSSAVVSGPFVSTFSELIEASRAAQRDRNPVAEEKNRSKAHAINMKRALRTAGLRIVRRPGKPDSVESAVAAVTVSSPLSSTKKLRDGYIWNGKEVVRDRHTEVKESSGQLQESAA